MAAVRGGVWDQNKGTPVVSPETSYANTEPSVLLFLRKRGSRSTSGAMFLFTLPPQSLTVERGGGPSVTPTRHGYVVSEGPLLNPTFILQGHFGWRLRTVISPREVVNLSLKSNVSYDQVTSDLRFNLPFLNERGPESVVEKFVEGKLGIRNFIRLEQTLDGRQSYFALRDIIVYYVEENQRQMAKGKAPYEMVLIDTLHSHRWVVSPKHPTLKRTVETQGTHPYTLELIGVYDDARPYPMAGDQVWSH